MHYYSFRINDHAAETGHLSLIEDAIYRRLIDLYFRTEKPLQDDAQELARLIRARDHENEIKNVLREFFVLKKAGWYHAGCDEQLSGFKAKSDKARNSAKKRWSGIDADAMPTQCERIADAMPTHSDRNADAMLTNNHEPITNNHEPITILEKTIKKAPRVPRASISRPDDVSPQVWADWMKARGRTPLTETAWSVIVAEATKAGVSPGKAVEIAAGHGWRGFKADWLNRRSGGKISREPSEMSYEAPEGFAASNTWGV
jgi:uncharacterized protein YdaU (DUF1376 family)